jgi:hypothetical protein
MLAILTHVETVCETVFVPLTAGNRLLTDERAKTKPSCGEKIDGRAPKALPYNGQIDQELLELQCRKHQPKLVEPYYEE